MMTFATFYKKM